MNTHLLRALMAKRPRNGSEVLNQTASLLSRLEKWGATPSGRPLRFLEVPIPLISHKAVEPSGVLGILRPIPSTPVLRPPIRIRPTGRVLSSTRKDGRPDYLIRYERANGPLKGD